MIVVVVVKIDKAPPSDWCLSAGVGMKEELSPGLAGSD